MEIDITTIMEIQKFLKRMYDFAQEDEWEGPEIQLIIWDGADLYADYFRNNN